MRASLPRAACTLTVLLAAVTVIQGCHRQRSGSETSSTAQGSGSPLQGKFAPPDFSGSSHEDGQWGMAAKNYAATRYSGLDEINTSNVSRLKVAWTFSTGNNAGHEAPPLVVGLGVVRPGPEPGMSGRGSRRRGSGCWQARSSG